MSIDKIVVMIGDEAVTMTFDEARALWADLDEIFSAPKTDFEKLLPYMPPSAPPINPTRPGNPMPAPSPPYTIGDQIPPYTIGDQIPPPWVVW